MTGKFAFIAIALVFFAGFIALGLKQFADGIRAEERNAVIERSIELTRATDKTLGVARKASDSDLCFMLGGQKGECQ